jgi:hypothetical protein
VRAVIPLALLASSAVEAEPGARIWLDPRADYVQPLIRAEIAGRPQALVFDTGSDIHCWSLERARRARVPLEARGEILDFAMRAHHAFVAGAKLSVEGLGTVKPPLLASTWIDSMQEPDIMSKLPHFDGVVSPQELAEPGRALLVDFRRGEWSELPWPEARARVAQLPLALAEETAPFDKFLVEAQVEGRPAQLAIDTGASRTALYQRRGADLPDDAVRFHDQLMRVHVADFDRELVVDRIEPLEMPPFDGLLGMDVLRDCALALDGEHIFARCDAVDREPLRVDPSIRWVRFGADGPWLIERADGGYHYDDDGLDLELLPDGTFSMKRHRSPWMQMRTESEQREWVLDVTALARYHIARSYFLRMSLDGLPRHLAWVWSGRAPAVERREILFRIWDEAAEPDDPELGAAGARARRIIDGFVRRTLPRDSPDGYRDDELARLNARRPRGPRFDPYRPSPYDDRAE